MDSQPPVIDVRGVSVDIDDTPVLRDIDLRIEPGEVVALLGGNGSGKSTLVRAIMGIVPTVDGSIALFGTPSRSFREWKRIGYAPQRMTAAAGLPATVREVVASGRLTHSLLKRHNSSDNDAIDHAIELVGLTERARDSVSTLSGGQQQRVLIARAAVSQPDLLVLDEPNAGVDKRSQTAFARALRAFVASGRTVLVVLHEAGPLASLIDRGVTLDQGRIVSEGSLKAEEDSAGEHHIDATESGLFG